MRARGWTCQRQANRVKCGAFNPPRTRKCEMCGKPRPQRKKPAHMSALELSYQEYVEINGGESCGICGKSRGSRRLDRDHDHKFGIARGLLCARCNRQLPAWVDIPWLVSAIEYLKRASTRIEVSRDMSA